MAAVPADTLEQLARRTDEPGFTAEAVGRVSLAALSSGATKEYPVVGCLMISYTTPTGAQGVGFFSVAGCKSVGDDVFIGREALLKAGLSETQRAFMLGKP